MTDPGGGHALVPARRALIALVLLASVAGIFDHDLWNPHEHRVGAMAREMADSGDWLVPHLGGRPLFHKPPLYYATGAVLYRLLPIDPARAIRLVSLLYALVALGATARIGMLLGGRRVAIAASLVTVTTLGFLMVSRFIVVDAGLVAFTTGAFWAFLESRRGWRSARWLFWIALAGAFLTKGFIGPALVVPGLLAYLWRERDLKSVIRLAPLRGHLIAAGIVAIWAVPLWLRDDGASLTGWLRDENLGRFLADPGAIYHHDEPTWFYVKGLALALLPWTPWAIWGVVARLRGTIDGSRDVARFLLTWIIAGLVLLTLSRTKRELYLAPLLPATSLLLADWLVRLPRRPGERLWTWGLGALALLSPLVCGTLWLTGRLTWPSPFVTFPVAIAGSVATFLLIRRRRDLAFWAAPALLLFVGVTLAYPPADLSKSHRPGMAELAEVVGDRPLTSWRFGETLTGSLSFQTGRMTEDLRGWRALEERLKREDDGYVLIRAHRWPFDAEPDESFPGLVRIVTVMEAELIFVLRPDPVAADLVVRGRLRDLE